jgi:hypothetical protein
VRDSDVLELAAAFLLDGSNEQPQAGAGQDAVDVSVDIYFGHGYTLDQVSATLDALDVALTAGFIAAESRETGQNPAELLERLASADDPLDVVWRVEYTEAGSLKIRAVIERVGGWASKHQRPTIWLLGGVGVFIPLAGLPLLAGVGVAAGAWVAAGAIQGIASAHDRKLSRKQTQGPKVGATPTPEIGIGLVPAAG